MASKSAIVTGGAQGIGKGITQMLLKDGYKVGFFDIDEVAANQTVEEFTSEFGSGSCIFFNCDVTESDRLKECCEEVEKQLGKVTVVVNNAASGRESNFKKLIEINMSALMDLTYLAVDKMRKDKGGYGGCVINISSGAGLMSFPGKTAYSAPKCGVIGFSKSMAASLDLAEEDWGVSIMVLCPTATATESFNRVPDLSPSVPTDACRKYIAEAFKQVVFASVDETAMAVQKLINDMKNGAVMRLIKPNEDTPLLMQYIEYKWTAVENN